MVTGGLVVREIGDEAFEVRTKLTVPFPVPEGGDTDTHGTGLDAVHPQLLPLAFTGMLKGPPPPTGRVPLTADASTVTEQASASWVMANVLSAMTMARFWTNVVELGATT
jgi:hypothetical protein